MWKLNCDATWNEKKKQDGIDWVVRHWDGSLITAGFQFINHPWKINWLEALVVCEVLKSVPTIATNVRVELDALQIVHLLNNQERDDTEISNFIWEAQDLISSKRV